MAIYAISDLHLAFMTDKPMGIFGDKWKNHEQKIKENWIKKIKDDDLILIAGDISWALKAGESEMDLQWIEDLPGNKIICKGNHDFWWGSIKKLNEKFKTIKFIQNNCFVYNDIAICGSRGWNCPEWDKFTEKDRKIYLREEIRLRLSLEEGKKSEAKTIIGMIHYPPMHDLKKGSAFTKAFTEYGVEKVVYGHIHGPSLEKAFTGQYNDVEYILTSADYIDFDPVLIEA